MTDKPSDDLRTRITEILSDAFAEMGVLNLGTVADAVIREIGLTYECRYCGGWGPEHG